MMFDPPSPSASALAIDSQDNQHVFLTSLGGGLYESEDRCQTWTPTNNGLTNLNINSVVIDPNNHETIYVGTDNGAFISYDGGQTWGEISEGLIGPRIVFSIVVDPQDSNNVYAVTPYGIFRLAGR